MIHPKALSWAILAASVAFAIVPFFTSFNGYGPDAFPIPQVNPPAQPAGYAFAIWGVIYLWLIISAVFGLLYHSTNPGWAHARKPLLLSLIAGVLWLPIAETNPIAATVLIWFMLITALITLARAPLDNRWIFRAPIGLYAGWLAAASWVSVALVGGGFGIVFTEPQWAVIIILAASILSISVLFRLPEIPEFGISVVWALVAVFVKLGPTSGIAWLAAVCACVLALLTVRQFIQLRR